MQSSTPIIDIHVHSTLKPYGNSFYPSNNSRINDNSACIWAKDPFSITDTIFENTLGISKYRQSDFSTIVEGQYKIVCISHYPIEKEFFELRRNPSDVIENFIAQFASLLGKERIIHVKSDNYNYFEDLCKEYEFMKLLNMETPIGGAKMYKLMTDYDDINDIASLHVIITIEGCHAFCNGKDTTNRSNWDAMEDNVKIVKNWDSPPFFVTFAHHFYNGLCTHAKSLFDASGNLLNQEYGMRNGGFTHHDNELPISDLGEKLIDLLLFNENERRILIDVKHMSLEARKKYYSILKSKYNNEENPIPIIWSHGAVDFDGNEINMNLDVDVKTIYQSNGLIGIEIDQRILGFNKNRLGRWFRSRFTNKNKKAFYEAEFFWKQIITIAEYAYKNGFSENPWKCLSLGSDYDGVINPLNSYRDVSKISTLYQNLILHLEKYWDKSNPVIIKPNGTDAQDVIYQIMYKNAHDFIKNNYKHVESLV